MAAYMVAQATLSKRIEPHLDQKIAGAIGPNADFRVSGHAPDDCPHCADLREQVAYLRSELGLLNDGARLAQVRDHFDLGPVQARILLSLSDAAGRPLSARYLEHAAGLEDGALNLVRVHICNLRHKIGADAIKTVWAQGYRITESGLERVRNALGPDQRSNPAQLKER